MFNYLRSSRMHTVYDAMPNRLKIRYRLLRLRPTLRSYSKSPEGLRHTRAILEPMRDAYRGKRVVLMGNGPSLAMTNWSKIRNEFTIGLNRIYLLQEEMGFVPSFHVCVNELVIRQFAPEMLALPCLKFMDWQFTRTIGAGRQDIVRLPALPTMRFHKDICGGWNPGYTVTFAALQLAYYLGFSQVMLIGVDHNFTTQGPANTTVVSNDSDPNHFHPDYFGKGVQWQLPDLDGSEFSYQLARQAFESDGREIIDCTRNGKLVVFRKQALEVALR